MNEITLPWPDRELHPNIRVHWSVKSKKTKIHRNYAWIVAKEEGLTVNGIEGRLHIWIDGFPKDKRRRDADGLLSACKAYLDGIADALGVDDRFFVPHPCIHEPTKQPAVVRIRITGAQA